MNTRENFQSHLEENRPVEPNFFFKGVGSPENFQSHLEENRPVEPNFFFKGVGSPAHRAQPKLSRRALLVGGSAAAAGLFLRRYESAEANTQNAEEILELAERVLDNDKTPNEVIYDVSKESHIDLRHPLGGLTTDPMYVFNNNGELATDPVPGTTAESGDVSIYWVNSTNESGIPVRHKGHIYKPIKGERDGERVFSFKLSFIPLARTDKKLITSGSDEFALHFLIGLIHTEEQRGIVPIFIGHTNLTTGQEALQAYLLRKEGAGNVDFSSLFSGTSLQPQSEMFKAIDRNLGKSNMTAMVSPNTFYSDTGGAPPGYPPIYGPEEFTQMADTAKRLNEAVLGLSLRGINESPDYTLETSYDFVTPTPVSADEAYPLFQSSEQPKLPDLGEFMDRTEIDSETLRNYPMANVINITETSSSIF